MVATLTLAYDDPSPDNGGFSLQGGKQSRLFRVTNVENNPDLANAITKLIGDTSVFVSADGRMSRSMPLADPNFSWLVASEISDMRGRGQTTSFASDPTLIVPTLSEYLLYSQYDFRVGFTQPKYPIVPDSYISTVAASWYPDVNTDSTATLQNYTYATETDRYTTEPHITSAFEFVSAQQGNMKFVTNGTTFGGFNPNGKSYPAKLKMLLPNMMMRVQTVAMPYRYFTSSRSYITGGTTRAPWIGRVNQNSMTIAGSTFPAGSLLYLGFDVEMYQPPVPQIGFAPGTFDPSKLMNLTLNFSYTTRTATDLAGAPSNRNYIQAGHNLQPWTLTRKFHYAASAASIPSWPSAPLELLWTDPDFVQVVG